MTDPRSVPTKTTETIGDWCECRHPDHFDSEKDEHSYGAHKLANFTMASGARFCSKCAAYHMETHSHQCANPTGLCAAQGYCECACGYRRYAKHTSEWIPASRSPTADPEKDFGKLIAEFESLLGEERLREFDSHEEWNDAVAAARQSLVDYVGGIRKELRFASRSALLLDNQFKEVCAELALLTGSIDSGRSWCPFGRPAQRLHQPATRYAPHISPRKVASHLLG